jgi:DNA-directed RNA polymerase specialized sigma24 family protein
MSADNSHNDSSREEPRASHEASGVEADAVLVARCLEGDESGWAALYERHHFRLLQAIKFLLGDNLADFQLVDELAARVWFALVRDDARLLARYNPRRHARLDSFLAGLARVELLRYERSEQRRKSHEWASGCRSLKQRRVADVQILMMVREFAATLTPAEREFLETNLIAQKNGNSKKLTAANTWQRRHRIRSKLKDFLKDG